MRILLVSQMYPGPDDPDLGVFVANLERELAARGHELERAVVDRRAGGKRRHLGSRARRAACRAAVPPGRRLRALPRSGRPDRGARVARAARRHRPRTGRRERSRRYPACVRRRGTSFVARLRRSSRSRSGSASGSRKRFRKPQARPRSSTAASTSSDSRHATREAARAEVGWHGDGTAFLCLGALSERKNVLRLARAFEQRGEGTLTFVGDGPLRAALEGRPGDQARGAGRPRRGSDLDRRLRRPLPAEPRRAVRARDAGGDGVGALRRRDARRRSTRVRDSGVGSARRSRGRRALVAALSRRPRSRAPTSRRATPPATTTSSCRRHGWRRFSSEPLEIGEPDLDQRANRLLEPGLTRHRERLFVGRAHLLRRDALFQPVVAR